MNSETAATDIVERVVMHAGICGRHHDDNCQSCRFARECTDAEIDRLHADIEGLRLQLMLAKAFGDSEADAHNAVEARARDLQRELDARPKIGHASGCVKINCAGCGTDFYSTDYSGPAPTAPREDFLTRLRRISAARVAAWANGEECDEMFHATELGGETGEILNVVKKLYRERRGWRGSRATVEELGEEIGDALICLDKLAAHYDIDLAAVTAKKFDATSEKVGLPHRLGGV